MKVPTISQYNSWSLKDRQWWIATETGGKYKSMKRSKGYFPLIVYPGNISIVYQVNNAGVITEAEAMTITEAMGRLTRFERSIKSDNGNKLIRISVKYKIVVQIGLLNNIDNQCIKQHELACGNACGN